MVAKGRPLTPGELGCYSSHYHAWLALLDSQAAQMIVLEDDTIVDWTFLEKLATVDFRTLGVNYLRLYARRPSAFRLHGEAIEAQRYLVEYAAYAHGPRVRHHSSGSRAVHSPLPPGAAAGGHRVGPRLGSRRALPGRFLSPHGDLQRLDHRVGPVDSSRDSGGATGRPAPDATCASGARITRWLRVMTRLRSPAPRLRPR